MNLNDLESLAQRWPIFPLHWIDGNACSCSRDCQSPGKHPLIRNGVHGATQDMDKIAAWNESWPRANWAIACGGNSRLLVVDIDDYQNADTVMRNLSPDGSYPDAPTVQTGSGGIHYYFAAPDGWNPKNSASAISQGVDIRTTGGYVVAPGSRNLQGPYSWLEFEDEMPPDAPQWLIDMIDIAQADKAKPAIVKNERGLIVQGWHDWVMAFTRQMHEAGLDEPSTLNATHSMAPKVLDFASRPDRKITDKEIIDAFHGAAEKFPQYTAQDDMEARRIQAALIGSIDHEPIKPPERVTLPPELFEGLRGPLRALYEYCLHAPRPQPEMALAAALTTFSAVLGGKVETCRGLRTNLYTIAVCGSGGGKDAPRKACKRALLDAMMPDYIGSDHWQSGPAIHTQMVEHSRRICYVDEFGKVVSSIADRSASNHVKEIPNILLKIWGSADGRYDGSAYADGKKNVCIDEPHLCIYGTTTHGTLFANLTAEHYTDGLLARCLVVAASDDLPQMNHDYAPQPPHPGLVAAMKAWRTFGIGELKATARIHETDAANDMLRRFSDQCDERIRGNPDKLVGLWSRAFEKAHKIALVYACAIDDPDNTEPPVIDGAAVEWAIAFVEATTHYAIDECRRSIAETSHERDLVQLEAFIRNYSDGISLSELRGQYRKVKADRLNELRQELEDQGRIALRTIQPPKGRPVTYVHAV